jgi:uncharacterized iron-regulated protein
MRPTIRLAVAAVAGLMAWACATGESASGRRFLDLSRNEEAPVAQVLPRLKESRIVLVGEHHTDERHHRAQLEVIRLLHESGLKVAVGLEMFRRDSQASLDRWTAGEIDEKTFEKIYDDNWNFPWRLYRDIFLFARAQDLPMVGLNVPSEITRQVARQGYASLEEEKKQLLGDVACRVDQEYMDFIRRAFGGHAHGNLNFLYFCEAQMVWDTVMAVTALQYLERNPDTVMVILSGAGHARKQAIPAQINSRSDLPLTVILPEAPGSIERGMVDAGDADYLYLDLI